MEKHARNHFSTKKLARLGLLAALGTIFTMIEFPLLPMVPFLKYDPADIPVLLGTLFYGPLSGLMLTVVVSYFQSFVFHGSGGVIGFVMHVVATGMMVIAVGCVRKYLTKNYSLILSLISGTVAMTLGMIAMNLILTPIYLGTPIDKVIALLPFIILFNLIKAGANCAISHFVYKNISKKAISI